MQKKLSKLNQIGDKMTIRDVKGKVEDLIPVNAILVSVSDKTGLETLANGILEQNPQAIFFSTGGTYKELRPILGSRAEDSLVAIEAFTGVPEMEGGLVKTLTHKIHAGILGERNNEAHQTYLMKDMQGGTYFDMLVVNLYPFSTVTRIPDTTFESARGHIDVGGPSMLRGAAKNFLSCAPICSPNQYDKVLEHMRHHDGCTTLAKRFELAQSAYKELTNYNTRIRDYFVVQDPTEISEFYLGGE
jgi:phosphoribosylaminoimidazolecarboxamide formyltransferase/IMP cyclohydrolase